MTPWRWEFTSEGEVRKCLEEYTTFGLAQGTPSVGGDLFDPNQLDRETRVYAQNRSIDLGMILLKRDDHKAWDLLHGYYRMGAWHDRRGWYLVARMLGWDVPAVCSGSVRCRVRGDNRMDLLLCRVGAPCDQLHEHFLDEEDRAVGLLYAIVGKKSRAIDRTAKVMIR